MRTVLCCGFFLNAFFCAAAPIEIGSHRELFIDSYLVEKFQGDAELVLHKPRPREVVLVTDKPWEGNTSAYYTIFRDGDLYRMYYRGSHYDETKREAAHREVTCYAESEDGIVWTKPELGLFEFNGSKRNNIVWDGIGTHCFVVFKDKNPSCETDSRYKAIARGRPRGNKGLYVFKSPDGIIWSQIGDGPVITEGAFDSQNLAFWDPHAKLYREYHRTFVDGVRAIMTGTSKDFVQWTDPVLLEYGQAPKQHLYTNAVQTYFRAPQILLGFPTRYLPQQGSRVEPTFMASRDGRTFRRWLEAVIPESAPKDRSGNRSNYMTWGMVQLPGNDRELSVYATEAYYKGPDSRVRRFSYRVDGFTSLRGIHDGALTTKPLVFEGNRLSVNFATLPTTNRPNAISPGGSLRIELQDADGEPLAGYSLNDCDRLHGDEIEKTVTWKGRANLTEIKGKPIRMLFALRHANLYSFRFSE